MTIDKMFFFWTNSRGENLSSEDFDLNRSIVEQVREITDEDNLSILGVWFGFGDKMRTYMMRTGWSRKNQRYADWTGIDYLRAAEKEYNVKFN